MPTGQAKCWSPSGLICIYWPGCNWTLGKSHFSPAFLCQGDPPTLWLRCRWSRGSSLEPEGHHLVHKVQPPQRCFRTTFLPRYTREVGVAPDSFHFNPRTPPWERPAPSPCFHLETQRPGAPHRSLLRLPHLPWPRSITVPTAARGTFVSGACLPALAFHVSNSPLFS